MYKTGEKPGKGTYVCTRDNEVIHLDQDTDTLPPCPRCSFAHNLCAVRCQSS